jgi:hypothetical protein
VQGDELKFIGLTDSIRKECRAIDKDMIGLPELRLVHLLGVLMLGAPQIQRHPRVERVDFNASGCIALCSAPSAPVWLPCTCVQCVSVANSFDIMMDWSSPGGLFPGSLSVDSQELSMLLLEINSEAPPFTRYEVAKRLKELCQYDSNRRALADLLKEQFVTGLQSMLKDDNEDIVRFAIYTILNFADDVSTLNE